MTGGGERAVNNGGDLASRVTELLSDPNGIAQIMSAVRALGGSGPTQPQSPAPDNMSAPDEPPPPEAAPVQQQAPPFGGASAGQTAPQGESVRTPDILSGLSGLAGNLGLSGNQMSSILSALSGLNRGDDENIRLLASLKPFLSEARSASVDEALRAMRLAKVAEGVISGFRRKEV